MTNTKEKQERVYVLFMIMSTEDFGQPKHYV